MTSKISLEFNDYFMTRECREESFIDFSFVVINTYTKQRYTCTYLTAISLMTVCVKFFTNHNCQNV